MSAAGVSGILRDMKQALQIGPLSLPYTVLLTLVAIAAVHAGHGYTISEGGWKLPLIYLVMLLPLILSGPGRLSLDHWLRRRFLQVQRRLWS